MKLQKLQLAGAVVIFGSLFLYLGRWSALSVTTQNHMTMVQDESPTVSSAGVAFPDALQKEADALRQRVKELEQELAAKPAAGGGGGGVGAASSPPTQAEGDALFRTSHRCVMTGAWGDYCVYDNVCFTSAKDIVWVSDKFTKTGHSGAVKFTTKLPLHEPHADRMYPALTHLSVKHMTPEQFEKEDPIWADTSKGALYLASYYDKLANIWYWCTRMLPIFTAQRYADVLNLPPVGEVVIPMIQHKATHTWARGMLNVTLDKAADAKVYFMETPPYHGMSGSDGRMVCAKQAVVMGAQVYGVPDMIMGRALRQRAYEYVGLPPPPLQQPAASEVPHMVTLLDRRSKDPRHVLNVKEVEAVVRKYGVDFRRVELGDDVSFEDQVKLFAATGVLVAVHGAGLMNQIFLPPGAVTIEIFPNHVKHVLYERIATMAGVYHFKVYADDFPPGEPPVDSPYARHKCGEVLSMEVPEHENGYCWRIVKNSNVVVPIPQFEEALVQGLDFFMRTTKKD